MQEYTKHNFELFGKSIQLENGKLAKQADGAVLVTLGETVVLVTTVSQKKPREGADFLPLTIEVDEKMYAAGKIPGSFFKREGRPSETATLTCRLIDRPLRPSFPKGFFFDTQIVVSVLSADQINPPDVLGLNGASMALMLAGTPFNGPVSGVRVGRVSGEWIINPTFQDLDESDIDLVVAGTDEAILMVEAGAKQVSEEDMVVALQKGHEAIRKVNEAQRAFVAEAGKEPWDFDRPQTDEAFENEVRELVATRLESAIKEEDKLEREKRVREVKEGAIEQLKTDDDDNESQVKDVLKKIEKEIVRKMILNEGKRVDGRALNEIRKLDAEIGLLPRTHGSGLFTRGQTQALSVVTLGTLREDQMIDGIGIEDSKRFLLHYNFPPFSVGETGRMTGPRRRDIGHGALGERALLQVIPDEEEFPYMIRIVS